MTLSRIGTGASLSLVILTVWLGACSGTDTESCGRDGLMNGTCVAEPANSDACPSGQVKIDTSDSMATGCPETYNCCAPASSLDSGVTPVKGSGSGS